MQITLCKYFVKKYIASLKIICTYKYVTFNFISTDNNKKSSRAGCKETIWRKIVQSSAVPESGLIIQNKELRQLKSLNYSALGNPSTMSGEVKREVSDQGTCTYHITFEYND